MTEFIFTAPKRSKCSKVTVRVRHGDGASGFHHAYLKMAGRFPSSKGFDLVEYGTPSRKRIGG